MRLYIVPSRILLTVKLLNFLWFGVVGHSFAAALTLDKAVYSPGETICATFTDGPGNATGWIGLYASGVTPDKGEAAQSWMYTNGTRVAGSSTVKGTIAFMHPPLGVGQYAAWFFSDDGHAALTVPATFTVTDHRTPTWRVNAINLPHAVVGSAYSAKLAAYASAPEQRHFAKTDGPAWLQVSSAGVLSGTPTSADLGLHPFTIRLFGATSSALGEVPLYVEVQAAGQENVPRLSVLSHNTWYHWTKVNDGLEKAAAAILQSGADVVGLQEATTATAQQLADELGWSRAATGVGSAQIVSRYPIVQTYPVTDFDPERLVGARIRLTQSPVHDIVVFDCHTDYTHYGPYAARLPGATEATVLAEENRSTRAAQVAAILHDLTGSLDRADVTPVFLTGDFNAPSHLDWVPATAAQHGGVAAVGWPTSKEVGQAGLLDSLRVLHPDPRSEPAYSWSTVQKDSEPQDRIDFIYYKGKPVRVLAAGIYHAAVEVTLGAWDSNADTTPVRNNTWPSDHAAMLTTFRLDSAGLAD